jgi:hypothetical protein
MAIPFTSAVVTLAGDEQFDKIMIEINLSIQDRDASGMDIEEEKLADQQQVQEQCETEDVNGDTVFVRRADAESGEDAGTNLEAAHVAQVTLGSQPRAQDPATDW